jgi:hypothetical protein
MIRCHLGEGIPLSSRLWDAVPRHPLLESYQYMCFLHRYLVHRASNRVEMSRQ